MLVTSLSDMESIVADRDDLVWEGWNVVKYTKSPNAMFSVDGCFYRGQWMKKTVFPLTEDGWHIPNSIGRVHARVEG